MWSCYGLPLLHWGKHCSCVHVCVRLVLQSEEGGPLSGQEPTSLAMAHEQDGYVMVDLTDIVRPLSWMFLLCTHACVS